MPIHYRYIEKYDYFDTVFSGVVTDKEILDLVSGIRQDPRFRAGANELVRSENLISVIVSPDTFVLDAPEQELLSDSRVNNKKIAIVANQDYLYGYGRMYQTVCEPTTWEIELFDNLAEAEKWIKEQ